MKRARFLSPSGTPVVGEWREDDGILLGADGKAYRPEEVTYLPPTEPKNVVGLALNFRDHASELGLEEPPEPTLFLKPHGTLIGHKSPVLCPPGVEYFHYEVELAAVIGRKCRRVPASRADEVIGGYTIANDLTVRDFIRNMYRPPVRAKGWDTFCPMGPFLVDAQDVGDPGNLSLRAYVNGELRQEGTTKDLIHGIPLLVEFITSFMTLYPGDVILTGTPKGLSHIYPGDVMRLEVEKVGALENPIILDEEEGMIL